MKQLGFTIVELAVVAVIMAILITLAVVNVRSTQIDARDSERHTDTKNIATALESYYNSTVEFIYTNTYPGVTDMGSWGNSFIKENVGDGSLQAPGSDNEWSIVAATNANQTVEGVRPAPTTSTYVYQALLANNNLCNWFQSRCAKFNLFYKLERATDDCPEPHKICVIRSMRQ